MSDTLRCGCGTELHDDDAVWFWSYGDDDTCVDRLVETTVGHSDADELLADGEEPFCSNDCGSESRCARAEARWFEDAAYGIDY
jgi:hypothetical protein